jgi:hypothetical protein
MNRRWNYYGNYGVKLKIFYKLIINMSCKFTKFFEEPKCKYNCLSTSLFISDRIIKLSDKYKSDDVYKDKIELYYRNLMETERMMRVGKYPDDFYLRIYYDKTIEKIEKFKIMINMFRLNNKIQLVEFEYEKYKIDETSHINLLGTLIRFYSIFDKASKNMEYCIIYDCDTVYTKIFFEIFEKFKRTERKVCAINSISSIYLWTIDYEKVNDISNFIWLIGCDTVIKRDKIFKEEYWDKYFNNMYKQRDLIEIYDYLDFKNIALNNLLSGKDEEIISYKSFNYGTDEIWLNYVINKILKDNNKMKELMVYYTKDYSLKYPLIRLKDLIKYNKKYNKEQYQLFIRENRRDDIEEEITKLIEENNINKIINFFKKIRTNMYYDNIYLQSIIRTIINNIEILIKSRGKYKMNEIISTYK